MDSFSWQYLGWAIALGSLSAISLPLGSLVGLRYKLSSLYISILAAFGAGALITAFAIELVAPTVAGISSQGGHGGHGSHGDPLLNFVAMISGAILGGIFFVVLDQIINARGGFLRKTATTLAYFRRNRRLRAQRLLEELSKISMFQNISPDKINILLQSVDPVSFTDGEVLFKQGYEPKCAFIILQGKVSQFLDKRHFRDVEAGGLVGGYISFLTGSPELTTCMAQGIVMALEINKENFQHLRELAPEFDAEVRRLALEHLKSYEQLRLTWSQEASDWAKAARKSLRLDTTTPTPFELQRTSDQYHGAPLAIWLGMLIDGLPESFVVGSGMLAIIQLKQSLHSEVNFLMIIPYTLIAGLFLSNFPEALASSVNMSRQGWDTRRIFLLWFGLMVMVALSSGLGYLVAGVLSHGLLVLVEGFAAGAMLTMIVSTMIPEAVHLGNPHSVGLSTLAGFLCAVLFKLFE